MLGTKRPVEEGEPRIRVKRVKDRLDLYNLDERPIDLTIYIQQDTGSAFGLEPPKYASLIPDSAGVHADRISFCAHSAGTHTECAAHINSKKTAIEDVLVLEPVFTECLVVRVVPEPLGDSGDTYEGSVPQPSPSELVISRRRLSKAVSKLSAGRHEGIESIIVLSGECKEWVFFSDQAADYLVEQGFKNLLVDKVSIDREYCGPHMPAHRRFLQRDCATVTENVRDKPTMSEGRYLLNLQLSPFVGTDAVPSRVLLFRHI